jgi:hypothetical protein
MQIGPSAPPKSNLPQRCLQANHRGKRVADPQTFAELVNRSQIALVAVGCGIANNRRTVRVLRLRTHLE